MRCGSRRGAGPPLCTPPGPGAEPCRSPPRPGPRAGVGSPPPMRRGGAGCVDGQVTRPAEPFGEVDVLEVHEVARVETAHRPERLEVDEEAGARHQPGGAVPRGGAPG